MYNLQILRLRDCELCLNFIKSNSKQVRKVIERLNTYSVIFGRGYLTMDAHESSKSIFTLTNAYFVHSVDLGKSLRFNSKQVKPLYYIPSS